MPSEIRYILFDDAEVAKAVCAFWKNRGRSLPRGTILGVRSEERGAEGWFFLIDLQSDASLTPETLSCGGDELRDALVQSARAHSIPLAARASKRVERVEQHLCLAMRLGGRQR